MPTAWAPAMSQSCAGRHDRLRGADGLGPQDHPVRRRVVMQLLQRAAGEHACSSFELRVAKSTRTHHWRVLRQAPG